MELVQTRLQKTLSAIFELTDVRRIVSETLKSRTPVSVSGLGGSVRALFVAALWQGFRRPLVLIVSDPAAAESLTADVAYFHSQLNDRSADRVCAFPRGTTTRTPDSRSMRMWPRLVPGRSGIFVPGTPTSS